MEISKKTIPVSGMLLLTALSLVGCASVKNPDAPIAENYPHSTQKHVQAAKHWQIIADDTASEVQHLLNEKKINTKPIYVNLQSEKTEFSKAFNDFLITSLVNKGVSVNKDHANSLVVNYKIQPIVFDSYRSTLLPNKAKWTSLVAGVLVLRGATKLIDQENVTTPLAIAGSVDAVSADGAPSLELVITTSILKSNVYLARYSNVYYANNSDMALYRDIKKHSKVFSDPFYSH
jgi:hypothetical protein